MFWAFLACVQLFWLGVGLYVGAAWPSWTHKGKHRGTYQYTVRKPGEWPYSYRPKGRIQWT